MKSKLEDIFSPIQDYIGILDERIINEISSDSRALCSILQDIFRAGGKRLRPALSFLSFGALRKTKSPELHEKIFLIAEISELIHTASLVHDDIIDNSLIRRGKATANSKWDNAITVISGDFMFARAAVNLGKVANTDIVTLYAKVLSALCDGEIQQIEHKYDTNLNFDYYFDKSYKKTASLFEASTQAPAILLGDKLAELALANYGRYLGLAFQIVDDILDYSSDELSLGKPAGSDIKEGQVTLPLLYALENLLLQNPDKHFHLINEIQSIAETASPESIQTVIQIVKEEQGIERSFAKAVEFKDLAISSLNVLEDSIYKDSLMALAEFVVSRLS